MLTNAIEGAGSWLGKWIFGEHLEDPKDQKPCRNVVELIIFQTDPSHEKFQPFGAMIETTILAVFLLKACNFIYDKSPFRSIRKECKFVTNTFTGTTLFMVYSRAFKAVIANSTQPLDAAQAANSDNH